MRALRINPAAARRNGREEGWDLNGHVTHVYDLFRFRAQRPPVLCTRSGESRIAVQQSLMDWKADLGARHEGGILWKEFLTKHQEILKPLAALPRLGKLADSEVATVCDVVSDLEAFKQTSGRKLVFGSKAAHFHFPGLVPVMSSEVFAGLKDLFSNRPEEVECALGASVGRLSQSTPERSLATYRTYVRLGNALLRDVDDAPFRKGLCSYPLHAKLFEWWLIGQRGTEE